VHELDHSKECLKSPFIPESRFGTFARPNPRRCWNNRNSTESYDRMAREKDNDHACIRISPETETRSAPYRTRSLIIAQDDARQGVIEHNMVFVLVIGLAGAIFANAMVLLAFNLLVAAN